MVDANQEVRAVLEQLSGFTVTYQYPKNFNKLPAVSYYTLTERGRLSYDNKVISQADTVQIDIWTTNPKQGAEAAAEIYGLMVSDGWGHELTMDVPNPDSSVYHKTMRFTKIFEI